MQIINKNDKNDQNLWITNIRWILCKNIAFNGEKIA